MPTGSATIPAAVRNTLNLRLLSVPTQGFIFGIPAMRERHPRGGGPIHTFRRYNNFAARLTPLGPSGATPPPSTTQITDYDATLQWYGDWTEINEQIVLQNQERVLNEFAIRLGIGLKATEDELIRNMLLSNATAVNCTQGANGDNPTQITRDDVSTVTSLLLNNNGKMFLTGIGGQDKFASAPVRSAYFALAHTALQADLNNIAQFNNVWNYPNQQSVLPDELGALDNVRFLISSAGATEPVASALGATVYDTMLVAQEAFSVVDQDGANSEFIYRPAYLNGPLAQNVTLAYKFANAQLITEPLWVYRLRSTLGSNVQFA